MSASTFFATRLNLMHPLDTGVIAAPARAYIAAGRDIISFASTEPDFATPRHILDAAHESLERGDLALTDQDGTPQLKLAIRRKFVIENKLAFKADQVTTSGSARQVVANAMTATLNPGDEVVLLAPYNLAYKSVVELFEGKPVVVEGCFSNGFKLTPEHLERAVTLRTKWVVLSSPGYPSGAMYTRQELVDLAAAFRKYPDVWVLEDNTHEKYVLDNASPFTTLGRVDPELQARTLTLNAVGMSYNMTGMNIAYAGGPASLIARMRQVQAALMENPSPLHQIAARAALDGDKIFMADRTDVFKARLSVARKLLCETPGLLCANPSAAFYLMVDCKDILGCRVPADMTLGHEGQADRIIRSDIDLAKFILHEAGVALAPGSWFGLPGSLRISLATDDESVRVGCENIRNVCRMLTLG